MTQKSPLLDVASDPATCGRESINSSTSTDVDFTLKSSNVLAVVVDLAQPRHTPSTSHPTLHLALSRCLHLQSWVKYWTGSEARAACLVPTLLIQSSPVRTCALITVFESDTPRRETA